MHYRKQVGVEAIGGGGGEKGQRQDLWGPGDLVRGGRIFRHCSKLRLPFSCTKQWAKRKNRFDKARTSDPMSYGHSQGTGEREGRFQLF